MQMTNKWQMNRRQKSSANIKTIAERAKVSVSTVSRALRANTSVNTETRARVLKIAEDLGYVPNVAAQMLVTGKIATDISLIGIVYDAKTSMSDHYFSRIIRNIVEEAADNGLVTTISSISEHYDSILSFVNQLKENYTAGLILTGDIEDDTIKLFREHVPNIVIVDKPSRLVTSVCNDNEYGAFMATSHLIQCGFKRIALLESYPGHYFTASVRAGYQRALHTSGLPFLPELCVDGEYHKSDGYRPTQRLLESTPRPDAIFANDEMIIGALRAITERGLGVPDDISLFGFDDLTLGLRVHPNLSTVGVNYQHLARTAIRKILENAEEDTIVPVEIIVPVVLIHRDSVRCRPV